MTPTPVQIKKAWSLMAAYYGRQLSDEVLAMYAEDLSDLSPMLILKAMSDYRKNPKNRSMPLPAQIRDMIEPVETTEARAQEIAAKIEGAIVRYGYPNESLARQYIGEDGWRIVQRYGGWSHLCANHGLSINPTAFHAQIRSQLESVVSGRSRAEEFPTLPASSVEGQHLLSGEVMPDGEPVPKFEIKRQDHLDKLFADMDRRTKEMGGR